MIKYTKTYDAHKSLRSNATSYKETSSPAVASCDYARRNGKETDSVVELDEVSRCMKDNYPVRWPMSSWSDSISEPQVQVVSSTEEPSKFSVVE